MTKLPTTEKSSRKDVIVSGLLSGIKSFDRAVVTHWRFLLIGIPVALTIVSTTLGHMTALELCRESVSCLPGDIDVTVTAQPPFSSIEALTIIPDDFKLPFKVVFVCGYLSAFYGVLNSLYLTLNLVISFRSQGHQGNAE